MPLKTIHSRKTTSSWNTMCLTHTHVNIVKKSVCKTTRKYTCVHYSILLLLLSSNVSSHLLLPVLSMEKSADSYSIICKTKHSLIVSVILLDALANIRELTWVKYFPVFSTASNNRLWFYLSSVSFFLFLCKKQFLFDNEYTHPGLIERYFIKDYSEGEFVIFIQFDLWKSA